MELVLEAAAEVERGWITFLVVWRCSGSRSGGAAEAEARCRRRRLLQRKRRAEQELGAVSKLGWRRVKLLEVWRSSREGLEARAG